MWQIRKNRTENLHNAPNYPILLLKQNLFFKENNEYQENLRFVCCCRFYCFDSLCQRNQNRCQQHALFRSRRAKAGGNGSRYGR
ncbi:TPA: hypothetical protein ACFKZP_09810 [Neisseria gonorrhoeae]|uniref:Uncharacterized protein n=1 Tax=Neisseria gonorrhoeae TaxID=485 RepID=A0AAX2TNV7_NEIGO|nr:hypothetical protein A6J43_05970 [Neisseria gonorrhoeae]ARC01620.1 hypothetical protein A6J44_09755 [Neisseria gonorrhoeae]ARC04551.1 hypothetical protein A6J46_07925 [Neisseria gonorrhoeae]ASQ71233.1 hypothetical protein BZG33_05630 [Neisseria gonorrhoeae]ASQ73241.1 hypothetical protein BZG34_03710 [Neisseria gonorrhoeae]